VHHYRSAYAEWEARVRPKTKGWGLMTGGDLLSIPSRARWRVFHRTCDPELQDPDSGIISYWVRIERVRTLGDVLRWSCHLSGKNWLEDTDWIVVIAARVLPQLPPRQRWGS
jgi:hypothetical protein